MRDSATVLRKLANIGSGSFMMPPPTMIRSGSKQWMKDTSASPHILRQWESTSPAQASPTAACAMSSRKPIGSRPVQAAFPIPRMLANENRQHPAGRLALQTAHRAAGALPPTGVDEDVAAEIAGGEMRPGQRSPFRDDRRADARAERHHHQVFHAASGTITPLADERAARVVVHAQFQAGLRARPSRGNQSRRHRHISRWSKAPASRGCPPSPVLSRPSPRHSSSVVPDARAKRPQMFQHLVQMLLQ